MESGWNRGPLDPTHAQNLTTTHYADEEASVEPDPFQDYFFVEYEKVDGDFADLVNFAAQYYSDFFLPVELIKSFSPKVILVDIRIWYVSGIDLFRNLRRGRENIFCVVISHFAAIDAALEAILEGAYDYLRKPIIKRDLLNTLRECFHHTISEKIAAAENRQQENKLSEQAK